MTTKQTTPKISPYDSAMNKRYFVNLVSGAKFETFHHAEIVNNTAATIANKLTPKELDWLIKHIENIL